jgi:DNA-binding FadR family transcriptional regulator
MWSDQLARPTTANHAAERGPNARAATTTATGAVFETILAGIVRGAYPPRSRLPAERDLAKMLGSCRPTLREALRRLAEWNLVEARRGSGIVVRDQREWSIEVLPAFLRYGTATRGGHALVGMLGDLLALRRALLLEIIGTVADRIEPGKLGEARATVERAWEARFDAAEFAAADFDVIRAVVLAADFLPAAWLLNRLVTVYLDVARPLSATIPPPADYLPSYRRFLAALEGGDRKTALHVMKSYLENHDRRLPAALEAIP